MSLVYVYALMIRRVLTKPECMAVSPQWTTAASRAMFQAATAEFDNTTTVFVERGNSTSYAGCPEEIPAASDVSQLPRGGIVGFESANRGIPCLNSSALFVIAVT